MGAFDCAEILSRELGLAQRGVRAVLGLMDDGSTVPFIARYRKEATGGLDEVQIRRIAERRAYIEALHERRGAILRELEEQGTLDAALRAKLEAAVTKAELEDLYAPYKPKRRTRAAIARERGLAPLAEMILAQPASGDPRAEARRFVDADKGLPDLEAVLGGARDICAEQIADRAEVRRLAREVYDRDALVTTKKKKAHAASRTKFDDYADHRERVRGIASHRWLAIRRGEREGVLKMSLEIDERALEQRISVGARPRSPWAAELIAALRDALARLVQPRAEAELGSDLDERAQREAVEIFAKNLRELLLAAPFGEHIVLGIDPGQRTGCKCAVVDTTGRVLATATIDLVKGDAALASAAAKLLAMCKSHRVRAIAVGNGTHGRETEAFARDTLRDAGIADVLVVSVSESGASVYSASELARDELPELDVTLRGAVSIARRLQDPLAELVKIDPRSIGVGQYQHDVEAKWLADKLDDVVEDCVNAVGVELNTASAPLLARVAGIGPKLGRRIVDHRHGAGAFSSRRALLAVPGVGAKTFEQAAGFLRIRGGKQPLDASAVHPERYALVETMARDLGVPVRSLVGDASAVARIDRDRYLGADVGRFTIEDIVAELAKPGRDPRAGFEAPRFRDDVRKLEDLVVGMHLEGVVTNVTAFGAFIDVGVKQDGLVHVSQLADRFVKNPSDVVKVGDRLKVRVLSVDLERKRISLSARSAS